MKKLSCISPISPDIKGPIVCIVLAIVIVLTAVYLLF